MTPRCLWLRSRFLELHLALPWPFAQPEFAFLVFTSFPYQFSLLFSLPAYPLGPGSVSPSAQVDLAVGEQPRTSKVPSYPGEREYGMSSDSPLFAISFFFLHQTDF